MTTDTSNAPPTCAAPAQPHGHGAQGFLLPTLGAIGVVFGDIGTSPLYALKAALDHAKTTGASSEEVVGVISLIAWALLLTVTLKYVIFLMRADNKGEGGMLSLMALAQRAVGSRTKTVFLLGIAGAALFSGDAIITPAISVLSAVEGLKLPAVQKYFDFAPYVLTIAVVILIGLFVVQRFGTATVAVFFGPIMVAFFVIIAAIAVPHILAEPRILVALDPRHGLSFLFSNGFTGFTTLGLVFLAVTGAEALYADMGHFGRRPIQAAWSLFVLPALLVNYFGQGAMILSNPAMVKSDDFSPFFQMAPSWGLIPLIALSTVATVIASQAVITGAFSIVRQGIQLGLLPRMTIRHMSEDLEGQIYVPQVNRMLLIGVLMLVFLFRTSDSLANAYGIAVTGTMVATTALAYVVVTRLWGWSKWSAVPFIGAFLLIDLSFLAANCVKVFDGGWMPLVIASTSMVVMWTWTRGTGLIARKTARDSIPLGDMVTLLEKSTANRVKGAAVFLVADTSVAPSALMHNLKHNKVLHERILLMRVAVETSPRVKECDRVETTVVAPWLTVVVAHFGYMESPRIPHVLASLRRSGIKLDIMTTTFFLGKRILKTSPKSEMPPWQDKLYVDLSRQAVDATEFFSIPSDRVVEMGAQVSI